MNDIRTVLGTIKENPGLCTSQIVALLDLTLRRVEDALWELWRDGKIQMEHDSTLRLTRDDEKVFRYDA